MELFAHIVERFIIHFFSGSGVVVLSLTAWAWCERKKWIRQLPGWWFFIVPVGLACFLIFLREPVDVSAGGWTGKSYIDLVSWFLGCGAGVYGMYRLNPRIAQAIKSME